MVEQSHGNNITLIGMPGSGKSTIGECLAERLGMAFLDGDAVIESTEGRTLQDIIDTDGLEAFGRIEDRVLRGLACRDTVIAPGGSAVYYPEAMAHLSTLGPVVYLHLPVGPLLERVTNMNSRGIAMAPGVTFNDLYEERLPLYRRYAGTTVDCTGLEASAIADTIASRLKTS